MTSQERSRRTIGIRELAASLGVSPFEVLSSLGLDLGRIRTALQEHGHEGLDESAALTALISNMQLELRPARPNGSRAPESEPIIGAAEGAAAAASQQLSLEGQADAPTLWTAHAGSQEVIRRVEEPTEAAEPSVGTAVEPPTRAEPPPLSEFVGLLRTYRWSFALSVLAVLAVTMALSFGTPNSYYAEAAVLVEPVTDPSGGQGETVNMATQAELVQSNLIASRVVERLALDADPASVVDKLDVSLPEDTEILELGYTAGTPQAAEERAQVFVEEYLAYRADQAARASASEQAAIEEEISTLQARLDTINTSLATASGAEAARLESEANQISSRIVERQLRLNAISVEPTVGVVLREASASFDPVAPDHVQNAILGLVAGLLLGGSVVVLRDRLDDCVHGASAVAAVAGRPLLGEVPPHPRSGLGARSALPTLHLPGSDAAESYRALAIDLAAAGLADGRPLVVAGARERSDGTVVVANLGIVLARTGKRVLLVDADVHDGGLARRFDLADAPGLIELLGGRTRLSEAVSPTDVEGLDVMRVGRVEPGASEALAAGDLEQVADRLSRRYDAVIFDVPSITGHPDTVAVVASVPDALLVVDSGAPRRSIGFAVRAVAKAGGKVHAVVVTKVGAAWSTANA